MRSAIERAMFEAPPWALLINPYFLPRRALHRAMKRFSCELKGNVLDVGCGNQPYKSLTEPRRVVGMEYNSSNSRSFPCADVLYDGKRFPFPDQCFEGAICNQVLEHVFHPEEFLAEIFRVLRPGAALLLSVPFIWREHEQPQDCLRYSSFGLIDRIESAGFAVKHHAKLVGGGAAICALAADNIDRLIRRFPRFVRLALRLALLAPLSLVGWLIMPLAGADPELYLDNFVVAVKPERK